MKKREEATRFLLNIVKKIVDEEIEIDIYSWPPHCIGLMHQPERPRGGKVKDNDVVTL